MLVDFLKTKSIKKQNQLVHKQEELQKLLARETNPEKIENLEYQLNQVNARLKEVHGMLTKLGDKRQSQIEVREIKKRLYDN